MISKPCAYLRLFSKISPQFQELNDHVRDHAFSIFIWFIVFYLRSFYVKNPETPLLILTVGNVEVGSQGSLPFLRGKVKYA